jgi:hypothetical protein
MPMLSRFMLLRISKPPAKNAIPQKNDPIVEPIKIPLAVSVAAVIVVVNAAVIVVVGQ